MRALAVFSDLTDWRARWLKKGFRHVLVAVEVDENMIVVIDPAGGGLHPWAANCILEDVAGHYRGQGDTVVETTADPGGYQYPTRWTCVEAVKRMLGVHGLFVLTPYQLFKRLTCET